jgi:hypothetical protein
MDSYVEKRKQKAIEAYNQAQQVAFEHAKWTHEQEQARWQNQIAQKKRALETQTKAALARMETSNNYTGVHKVCTGYKRRFLFLKEPVMEPAWPLWSNYDVNLGERSPDSRTTTQLFLLASGAYMELDTHEYIGTSEYRSFPDINTLARRVQDQVNTILDSLRRLGR